MAILSGIQLYKNYKNRPVVSGIDISIKSGEIVGLLGPNGAGKTTCFYMIVGLVAVDGGKVTLDDLDITHKAIHQRAELGIGYLPQEPSIFRKLSSRDNIMAVLELRRDLNRAARIKRCNDLLEELNVMHVADSKGMSLSGGERRRVEIARALAIEPKFMLLDEPFAGVDPISIKDIKNIITHLKQKGIGILITDHNVRETLAICDHAYIINQGRGLAQGTAEHILKNEIVRKIYLGEEFTL